MKALPEVPVDVVETESHVLQVPVLVGDGDRPNGGAVAQQLEKKIGS